MNPSPRCSRRWRVIATSVAIAAPVIALTAILTTANAAVPPPPAGWTTVFSDDFNGAANTGVNTANWLYDHGHQLPRRRAELRHR